MFKSTTLGYVNGMSANNKSYIRAQFNFYCHVNLILIFLQHKTAKEIAIKSWLVDEMTPNPWSQPTCTFVYTVTHWIAVSILYLENGRETRVNPGQITIATASPAIQEQKRSQRPFFKQHH